MKELGFQWREAAGVGREDENAAETQMMARYGTWWSKGTAG